MLTKDEIFDVDPSFKHLESFVDRISECQKFTSTAELHPRERNNNFLAFYGSTGVGKSWLMHRLHFECKKRKLAVGRLKLENDRLNDPVRIMIDIVEQIGENKFETWAKVKQRWNSIFGSEIDQSSNSTMNVANERDVNIQGDAVAGNKYQISGDIQTPAQRNPEDYKNTLTQNFLKDLSELLQREPVVFLLDNLDNENLAPRTREWILENLLDKPRTAKGYGVLAAITSNQELNSSIYFDILESDTENDEILPLEREHVIEYMRVRKIPEYIIEKEIDAFVQRTQGVPKKVFEEITLILKAIKRLTSPSTGIS